jgi:sugar phosphate permease
MTKWVVTSFSRDDLGTVWAFFGCAGNVGYILSPIVLVPLVALHWSYVFYVPGVLGMVSALIIYLSSSSDAVPVVVISSHATATDLMKGGADANFVGGPLASLTACCEHIFNINIVCMIVANALTIFTLKATTDWLTIYRVEHCGQSLEGAASLIGWSEIGGFGGTLLSGASAVKDREQIASMIFAVTCAASLLCMHAIVTAHHQDGAGVGTSLLGGVLPGHGSTSDNHMPASWDASISTLSASNTVYVHTAEVWFRLVHLCQAMLPDDTAHIGKLSFFIYGFAINGPKTLLQLATLEAVPTQISGTIYGVSGLLGQVGASAAGTGISMLVDAYGWNALLPSLAVAMLAVATLLAIPMLFLQPSQKLKQS